MGGAVARLKRRADFLKAASARRKWAAPGLILQARRRGSEDGRVDPFLVRVGFTVSRKVGNAVARNRARRRLRAAADAVLAGHVREGVDLVVIGRTETLRRPFPELVGDLEAALKRLGVWRDEGGAEAKRT